MNKKNILLADNSPEVRAVFNAVFNKDEYEITISNSAQDTLAHVFTSPPDIIILDGDLNVVNNVDVIRTLRASNATESIPALVILQEDDHDIKKAFNDAGACHYCIKPITPEKIRHEIESLIKGRNLFGSELATKIVAFCGTKGGCGTTTMAVNTALSLHKKDNSVLLLELANYFSGLKPALNIKTRKTVPYMLNENQDEITKEHVLTLVEEHKSGLKSIHNVAGIADMEKMDVDAVRFMRFNLCPICDIAIFDAGYGLNEATLELFDIADRVVFVSTLDIASLYNLEMITQVFEGTRISVDKCSVIFNHVHASGEIKELTIQELNLKIPILGFIPNHSAGFVKSMNDGNPYLMQYPKTPASKAINSISDKIYNFIKTADKKSDAA